MARKCESRIHCRKEFILLLQSKFDLFINFMPVQPSFSPARWLVPPSSEQLPLASSDDGPALDGSEGASLNVGRNQWFAWRANFDWHGTSAALEARIALDSKYFLWINGELVTREGGLKRGPAPDSSYFDVVNIAPFVRAGKNQIAVLQWSFGRQGFSHVDGGTPFFVFELAGQQQLNWKVRRHPAFSIAPNLSNGYRLSENSIAFDARAEMSGWTRENFDDSGWPRPEIIGSGDALVERPLPFWKDYGARVYSHIERETATDGAQIWQGTLPYNCQFAPILRVFDESGGHLIEMHTTNASQILQTHYTTRAGEQEFEALGWLSGERAVYLVPADVQVREIGFRETSYATDFVGEFECDDENLNILWRKSARTLLINMRDTFMDCPERERAPWWGDIVVQQSQIFYAFDERAQQLARKSWRELAAWQKPDGKLFTPCPAGWWNGELPDQMLASAGFYGAWTYAFFADDFETLRAIYPALRGYLELWQQDENGIGIVRAGEWLWGDWGDNVDQAVIQNGWLMLALRGAILCAQKCGDTEGLAYFSARAAALQNGFHAAFWNGTAYQSEYCLAEPDDRAQALAVLSGLADSSTFPQMRELLATQRYASPYMEKYVLEALFQLDAPALAIGRMRERYGVMIGAECSTLWEQWDATLGTLNHGWSGGPLTLLSAKVAGIAPLEAGFKRFAVRPQIGDLNDVRCRVPTQFGFIETRWQRADNSATFEINVPQNCVARVELPAPFAGQNGDWNWESNANCAELNAGTHRAHWNARVD